MYLFVFFNYNLQNLQEYTYVVHILWNVSCNDKLLVLWSHSVHKNWNYLNYKAKQKAFKLHVISQDKNWAGNSLAAIQIDFV